MSQYHSPRCHLVLTVFFDDFKGDVAPAAFVIESPRKVAVRRNAARKADECEIELNYRDFPIDPRMVSAIHVAVSMGDTDSPFSSKAFMRFIGYVDTPEIELDRAHGSLHLTGRDYTRLALDTPWRQVANEAPVYDKDGKATTKSKIRIRRGMTLGTFVTEWVKRMDVAVPSAVSQPEVLFESRAYEGLPLDKVATGSILAMQNGDTAWDVLLLVCEWYGLLPMWSLDPVLGAVLLIRSASAATNRRASFAWGRNVTEFKLSKNLQAPERKQVRIVAYNPRLGRAIAADYPKTPRPHSAMGPGGKQREPDPGSDIARKRYWEERIRILQEQIPTAPPESYAAITHSMNYATLRLGVAERNIAADLEDMSSEVAKQRARDHFFKEPVPGTAADSETGEIAAADFRQAAKTVSADKVKEGAALPKPATNSGKSTKTAKLDLRRVQYNLYGNYSPEDVRAIAKRVHEDQGRHRTLGSFKTRSLYDEEGQDIAGLGNGDILVMHIDPTTLHGIDHMAPGEAEEYLKDPHRANALPEQSAAFLASQLPYIRESYIEFYITSAEHVWDSREGYHASITFSDYIVDRTGHL